MPKTDDPMKGVPASLTRTFKSHADPDEGDRRVAENEAKRLDGIAKNQALWNLYGPGKGGPKRPQMNGPRPPGGHRRDFDAKLERECNRIRKMMVKEEYNRVKSIGETALKYKLSERNR